VSARIRSVFFTNDGVELELPAELYGGDPRGFLSHLGLRRITPAIARREPWAVKANDETQLVTSHDLATETGLAPRSDLLA
jgi:hypothetical protein